MFGPELEFPEATVIAITGADFGGPGRWRPLQVAAGTVLHFNNATEGCRGYLAVAGGIDVPLVLGSRSTFLRGRLGGWHGRALKDGDRLPVPTTHRAVSEHWSIDPKIIPPYRRSPTVRVVAGAQADEFESTLFFGEYQVSAQSDRMGFRLRGAPLRRTASQELRSATAVPGTIQAPPDGQPIVLMADAQTIGGYPQIAHVATIDLPLLAQLRPGDTVRFELVEIVEAREAALARERALAMLRQGLAEKLR
jgi:antagonist of KipI